MKYELVKSRNQISIDRNEFQFPERTFRLMGISEEDPSTHSSGGGISFKISLDALGEINVSNSMIKADDPSTIYLRAPISNPGSNLPEGPSYYPDYCALSPEEKYVYLNWLTDITQPIKISYVFLYLYNLERRLITDAFDDAFDEIVLLRKHHNHKSFLSYSYNSLVAASIITKNLEKLATYDISDSIEKMTNAHLFWYDLNDKYLTANEIVACAKNYPKFNKRYYKEDPKRYLEILESLLQEKYGMAQEPILREIPIADIPKESHSLFLNISFPENLRNAKFPDFINYSRFRDRIISLVGQTHNRFKEEKKSK